MDNKYCVWRNEEDFEYYASSCGHAFHFIDGNCKENNFKFCPYCGKPIYEDNTNE